MINSMFTQRVRVTISMLTRSFDKKAEPGLAAIRVQSQSMWDLRYERSAFKLKREGDDVTFDVPNVAVFREWAAKYAGDPHGNDAPPYDFQFAGVFQTWRWLLAAEEDSLEYRISADIMKAIQGLSAPAKRGPGLNVRHAVRDGQYRCGERFSRVRISGVGKFVNASR